MGDWKIRLSTLWIIHAISMVLLVVLLLFESGDLTHIAPPLPVDATSLLLVTVGVWGLLAMAFLSQSLADRVSRWLNIVVGAVYGIGAIAVLVMMLMGNPSVLALNMVFSIVVSVFTVWIAWKSK